MLKSSQFVVSISHVSSSEKNSLQNSTQNNSPENVDWITYTASVEMIMWCKISLKLHFTKMCDNNP